MPLSPSAPAAARFPELDGLRGLAALCVVLSHYVLAFQPALLGGGVRVSHFAASEWIGRTPLIALYNPELGVAVFFVLSGFVLAASVADRPAPLPALALRRWLRLALPILGTSALAWLLVEMRATDAAAQAAAMAKSDWLAGMYLWPAFAANDPARMMFQSVIDVFARGRHFYNPALWTMATEFWGSLVLFAGYAVVPDRRGLRLLAALAVLALVWTTPFCGFPCGVALFEARRLRLRLPGPAVAAAASGVLFVGAALGGMPYALDVPGGGVYATLFLRLAALTGNPVLLAHRAAAVALVAAALHCPPWRRLLCGRICAALGRLSFMVYLLHVPLLCALGAGLLLRLAGPLGYNAATAAILPAFLGVLLPLAALAERLIDRPALAASRIAGRWPVPPLPARAI